MNNEFQGGSLQETDELLDDLWQRARDDIKGIDAMTENWKIQTLPLARIKKIMKTEEFIMQELEKDRLKAEAAESPNDDPKPNVIKFMIAGEAPVVVSRACELLIKELTCRAWQHTERNRRRTLQRQDVHAAVGESDVYDFLIDIVPRVSTSTPARSGHHPDAAAGLHHNPAAAAHGIPQQMDPATNAHLMGQALVGATDLFSDPTSAQQMQYIMQLQQQAAAAAASAMDPSSGEAAAQLQQQQRAAAQGWPDQHTA